MKVAIVVHAYYQEQLYEIINKIRVVIDDKQDVDVYFTLPQERVDLYCIINNSKIATAIYTYPNQGMDLLPFFELIPSLQCYDWILKLHTKNYHDELNRLWFTTLLQALIGSKQVFRNNLTLLDKHPDWVMMGSLPFFLSAKRLMFDNQYNVDKLIDLWGLCKRADWGFFAGSLYWVRPNVLLAASQQLLVHRQWFSEVFAKDGQMAHALERVITLLVQHHGDIGLIYDDQFYINHKHPMAINQALSKQLLAAVCDIDEVIAILQRTNWLDIDKYKALSQLDFASDRWAYEHYALVGQFSTFAELVLPIALKRKQEKLLSWSNLQQRVRKKGLISIIIPVFNEIKLTISCLQSIVKFKQDNIEVVVVDNGSSIINHNILKTYCKLHTYIKLVRLPHNLNFSVGCNYGFSQSSGEYIVFLNNDTSVTKNWLSPLIACIKQQDIAMVQPLLLYPNNTVQCAGVSFDDDGFGICRGEGKPCDDGNISYSTACPALTGACMMLRADDFIRLSGFDTWFVNGQEDIDLCLRMQKLYPNKKLWYCADSVVHHHTSKTVGRSTNIARNRGVFSIRWNSSILNKVLFMNEISLENANKLFRDNNFLEALNMYEKLLSEKPYLKDIISFNISMIRLKTRQINYAMHKPDFLSNDIYEKILESGFFDPMYYYNNYKNNIVNFDNLLEDYLTNGLKNFFNASEKFNPRYYLNNNPDLEAATDGLFLHYVLNGQFEGRKAYPDSNSSKLYESEIQKLADKNFVDRKQATDVALKLMNHTNIIALYLPQFHEIPENNQWWGKGFTEWTNVMRGEKFFSDHYQPRIPGDLGYYDLSDTQVQRKQIQYAKEYGVGGFCFYYYWFDGKRLLEKPVENYLADKSLDHPYCLCWANENWTRRWDGLDQDLLIGQNHSPEDDFAFIADISRHFRDDRYIRFDGKPLLIIYRPSLFPNILESAQRWRQWCRENDIGEICLCCTLSFEKVNPEDIGFDVAMEFPPNNYPMTVINSEIENLSSKFMGKVYNWVELVENSYNYNEPTYKLIRGVNPGWDNTARKRNNANIIYGASPRLYQNWLENAVLDTKKRFKKKDDRLIVVNAWNEWAEGAYLEPDNLYGFSYLDATRNALIKTADNDLITQNFTNSIIAVVIHSFYPEILKEIIDKIQSFSKDNYKLYVTTPSDKHSKNLHILQNSAFDFELMICENRGRDVLPFFTILPKVFENKHKAILKLHTKKSKHRDDGDVWRDDLYRKLIDEAMLSQGLNLFSNSSVGMIAPKGHIVNMDYFWGSNKENVTALAARLGCGYEQLINLSFPGGTMFYVKTSALVLLDQIIDKEKFEAESGQTDGTYAHAIERLFGVLMYSQHLDILDTSLNKVTDNLSSYKFADSFSFKG